MLLCAVEASSGVGLCPSCFLSKSVPLWWREEGLDGDRQNQIIISQLNSHLRTLTLSEYYSMEEECPENSVNALNNIWPSWTHGLLSTAGQWADNDAKSRLQVAEGQRPVHRPVNLSSTPLGQCCLTAHVEVNKSRNRVEGLILQAVLDPGVGLTGFDYCLSDEKVKVFLLPVRSEDKVAPLRLRVSDEEVTVVYHQALCNLRAQLLLLREYYPGRHEVQIRQKV